MTPTTTLKSLSIRISTDGLSFCVYTPAAEQPYRYERFDVKPVVSMAANLKEALQSVDVLQAQYQRVNVLVSTPMFTTVPTVAFDREHIADTFNFTFCGSTSPSQGTHSVLTEQQHISYNVLRRSGIAIIFGLDRNVYQLLHDDFPRARFYAAASTLIEFFSERSMIGTGRKMYAYIHDQARLQASGINSGMMTLYCFDQGRLLYVNTYNVRGMNDCQYYLLQVWKNLGFDQLDDSLVIVEDTLRPTGGKDDVAHKLGSKLGYFIKQTSVIEPSDTKMNGIPYDLQTLLVCGF
ncbi:MAG: DUF3822 family protein [Bacteroidaceae bacterium]|nr:DUF3822 family protein [Bacteroidaceae bacterium]